MKKIFKKRLMTGTRTTNRARLLGLLMVVCAIFPAMEHHCKAQDGHRPGVAQPKRETDHRHEPLMNKLANIFRKARQPDRQVQTSQQRLHPNVPNDQTEIQQATYIQDIGPNGYQASPNPPPIESNYQQQQAWQHQNSGFPPHQVSPYFPGQFAPGYYDQSMNGGQSSRSRVQYNGAGQNGYPPRWEPRQYNQPQTVHQSHTQSSDPRGPDYEFEKRLEAARESGLKMSFAEQNMAGRGRGHLSSGPVMHGSNLYPVMKTATEFANELKNANEKLWERIERADKQLESKEAELQQAYDLADSKDRELQQSRSQVKDLKNEVSRMKAVLLIAQQENQKLRDQTEQTLKEIETTLNDEVFRSFSRRGD